MNLKKAKKLRKKATTLACKFIEDRVLTPEQTDGLSCKELLVAIPDRAYYWSGFTRKLGIGSKKWFKKYVKKHPDVTYEELLEVIYGAAK